MLERGLADFQNGDIVQLLYTETRRKQVSKNGRGKALRLQHPHNRAGAEGLQAAEGSRERTRPKRESKDKTKCKLAEARDKLGS